VDEIRISPAGDAFYAVAQHCPATDETPHGCALCMSSGFVFFGIEEDGEEEIERVPCRRCRPRPDSPGPLPLDDDQGEGATHRGRIST
jgi:hypothetical protein